MTELQAELLHFLGKVSKAVELPLVRQQAELRAQHGSQLFVQVSH